MSLFSWVGDQTKTGIERTFSEVVKLAILSVGALVFNYLLGYVPGLNTSFWASKRLAVYEVAILLCLTATASVWITHSIMQRAMRRIEAEAKEQMRRIEAEAKELSRLDPTTGLLNLRALSEQLPLAMQASKQTKEPISLIIFDIDNFKEVNTLIGHDRANVVLKGAADGLNPRAPDQVFRYPENVEPGSRRVVFRYGGDEFILIAFNTTVIGGTDPGTGKRVNNGTIMAERLQENVWKTNFSPLIEKRKERGLPTRATISAGIADSQPFLDPEDTVAELTLRAELALIEAKRLNAVDFQKDETFRGRIVPWSPELKTSS